ncbi:MAG: hypothetical protein M0R03_15560 [Novosphingobium sp.]|nr:hypothetical protein [Novosphingobium sp.]
MNKSYKHIVVFDGTIAYTIPAEDLTSDVKVLGRFNDFDVACAFEDKQNEMITNNGKY